VLPTFTLLKNPEKSKLDDVFIHGRLAPRASNMSSYLESVKASIIKDYDGGHDSGFFVDVSHNMRETFIPKAKWTCLPPFMRFKESSSIRLYGDSSISAREIGNYIVKMSEKFDFARNRFMLCSELDNVLTPIIAGNKPFLEGLKGQMVGYYKETNFVVTEYHLNVE